MVLADRSDGSTLELKMVLLQRSRWFLSESPRWFYFRGQEGSAREFKVYVFT